MCVWESLSWVGEYATLCERQFSQLTLRNCMKREWQAKNVYIDIVIGDDIHPSSQALGFFLSDKLREIVNFEWQ